MFNTKRELIEHYAGGDIHDFMQLDGWVLPADFDDCFMHPDDDGDCLTGATTQELRRSSSELAVRVQIHEGTTREAAIRLLKKITDQLDSDWLDEFFGKSGNRQKDNVIDFPPRQVILTDTDGEQVKITGKNAQVVKGLTEMLNDILNEKQNPAKIDHDKDCPPF